MAQPGDPLPPPASALEILDTLDDGVAAFDGHGCCTYANAAAEQLLGACPGELIGRRRPDVLDPASWPIPETLDGPWQWQRFHRKLCKWLNVRATPTAAGGLIVRIRDASGFIAAEQNLRRSEDRLRLAADAAQVGVLEWQVGRRQVVWANQRAYEIFGYSPEETPTRDHFLEQVLHPDDVGAFSRTLSAALGSGRTFWVACRIRRANDGELRWIEFSGRFERQGDRSPVWLIGVVADITERKRGEERVRRHAEEMAAIMEIAPVGLLVSRDPECRAIVGNRAANEIYGVPARTNYSETPAEGAARLGRAYFKGGRELAPFELPMQRAAAGSDVRNEEIEVVHGDGTRQVLWGNARPLRDEHGAIRGVVAAFLDISQRKLAEQALGRSQADLNHAQAVAHIGSWRLDARTGEFRWSDEMYRITGIPAGTPVNYEVYLSAVHPDDREYVDSSWRSALAGQSVSIEHRIVADGGVKWVRVNAEMELDPEGALLGGFGTVQDITARRLAEEALREADNRLRFALEASSTGYWDCDPATERLHCSPQTNRIFGYDGNAPEWTCDVFLDHAVPEDREMVDRAFHSAFETGATVDAEWRIRRAGGEVRWIWACGRVLLDDEGAPRRMVGIVQDVTARKQAASELAEAKRRQEILAEVVSRLLASEEPRDLVEDLARMVMERVDCQYFFNYLVEDGRLRLNASAGLDPCQVERIEWLKFGEAVGGLAAGGGARVIAEHVQESGDPRTSALRQYGVTACACHPLTGGNGVMGTLCFASRTKSSFSEEDATLMQAVANHIAIALERVRVQRALRASQALYRAVARGIPGGAVWVVDPALRFLVAEGSLLERLGISRESLEGRTLDEALGGGPFRPLAEERLRAALAGQAAGCESEEHGLILWTQYVPLRDDSGRVTAAMALALDITERKRVEEQLRHAQKLESIGVLAGGVAHDFNNLLASILGNASLAQLEAPPSLAGQLDSIVEASERAATLTRQLLAYAGKGRFQVGDVDLAHVILSSADLIRVSVPKNVDFDLDVPADLPSIRGDAAQMQQVVMNLVINAAEAIGPAGKGAVSIRAGVCGIAAEAPAAPDLDLAPGRYIRLEVRDTGCGMDEATRARMFDPFFTTKFTGRGLGLAAVQGILRGHKGGIAVRSAPGQGSTLTVFLPCAGQPAPAAAPPGPMDAGRPATVLVVDDEPAVRSFAKAALERLGHTVLLADNGRQALDVLGSAAVDLVLLDVVMPVIGGGEAAEEIRRRWPGVAVLLTSGYNREEARRLGGLSPGLPFLEKPYTVQTLAGAIKAALAARA